MTGTNPSPATATPQRTPEAESCKECGEAFLPRRNDQVFCQPDCRHAWHNRAKSRAATAYEILIKWRKTRGIGLGELSAVVDEWLREDREAGRATT